ncbi:MAG: hypothetical protein WCP03_02100 [Candidatus Saccharibacteria bacterium]
MTNKTQKKEVKASIRIGVNSTLISASFVIFVLLFTLNPQILKENKIIAIQIVMSIPLLVSATLARTRSIYAKRHLGLYKIFHALCFETAYAMVINSVGLLLSMYTDAYIVIIYFIVNITLALVFSILEIAENSGKTKERLWKDGLFIAVIVLFGLFPLLNLY